MLLEVNDLKNISGQAVKHTWKAVDNVSLSIAQGETLGLVGESGCGKSTFGRTLVGLYEPTGGSIRFDGREVSHLSEKTGWPLPEMYRSFTRIPTPASIPA